MAGDVGHAVRGDGRGSVPPSVLGLIEALGICAAGVLLLYCAFVALTSLGTYFGEGPSVDDLRANLWWCRFGIAAALVCCARVLIAPVRSWTRGLGAVVLVPVALLLLIAHVKTSLAFDLSLIGDAGWPTSSTSHLGAAVAGSAVAVVMIPWVVSALGRRTITRR